MCLKKKAELPQKCIKGKKMKTIIIVLFVALFLIVLLPIMGIEWIIGKRNPYKADISQLRMVQWAFRVVLFLSGSKVVVKGYENVPKEEAVLYVCNHRGFFDVVATYSLCPGLTGYISKDSIGKVPILGMIMKRLHCLFIKRDDMKQSMKVILTAIEQVKSGISICIFPEGTRNKDEQHPERVLPFKDGSFKIAQKTGCKIIPVAISGTAEVFENHFPWVRKSEIHITYGNPINITALDKETQKKMGAYCQNVIENMLQEDLQG